MSLVKSMTGYGRAVETVNGREFTVELRSVNNRYLDCTVKLPRSLSFGEDAVKQAVKNAISRGKVDVFLSVRSEGAADVKVTLNESMVAGYLAAMKQMAENFDVKEDISVSLLSRMPDVFTVEKPEVDEQQLLDDMLEIIHLDRTKVYIANVVKCRPPQNRDPLNVEQDACIGYLRRQAALMKPKIIVCLGRIAAKAIIKEDFKITQEHGQWFQRGGVQMTAIYHPAALLRDEQKRPETFLDLKSIQAKVRELCEHTEC